MKKLILSLVMLVGITFANAQVIFYVEDPVSITGNYDFTYAKPTQSWGVADLNDPLNAITDTLALVSDGTAEDSLGCNSLVNGSSIAGKIAVVYRGSCQFGTKAFNAETAGAVGVIIINNVPGAPIEMNGGTDGPNVTIPVIMVSDATGAILTNEMANGPVVGFIGSKTNFYGNDLGYYKNDVLMAEQFSKPALIAQNNNEFAINNIGAMVHNYGSNDQTNVAVNVDITLNGNSVYNQTSSASTIVSGDSAFFTLPAFSLTSYTSGYYYMTYTITSDSTDEFTADNTLVTDFMIDDSSYALCRLDDTTGLPANVAYYRPSGGTGSFTQCIHFQDANASRMQVDGIYFSASGGTIPTGQTEGSLNGEYFEVYVYEWADQFANMSDANFGINSLTQIGSGSYTFLSDLQNTNVYAPMTLNTALQDNSRYLFCVSTFNVDVYLGFDTEIDYDENVAIYDQPLFPIEDNGTWYALGFGTDVVPAISASMSHTVGIEDNSEVEITPYPNPAKDVITIPTGNKTGVTTLIVTDLTGKVVLRQSVNAVAGNVTVDASDLSNGTYIFNMNFEDGTHSKFNVVVTK